MAVITKKWGQKIYRRDSSLFLLPNKFEAKFRFWHFLTKEQKL
jgi:hypothetical protein